MADYDNIKLRRNMTALVEFSRIINSSLDLDFILNNILLTCMGKFLATKGVVALKENGILKIRVSKGLPKEILENCPEVNVNEDLSENAEFQRFAENSHLQTYEKISSSEECLGVICLGEKLNKSPYTEDDQEFLRTILNISATAVQNSQVVNEIKKVNRELDSRINRLNSLFELSKEFGLFSESTRVAKLLVYSVIGQFLVSKFAVVSFEGEAIRILESKYPQDELITVIRNYGITSIQSSISNHKIRKSYPEFAKFGIELIVPMQLQGKTKGLIFLSKRINNLDYSETDIEFIYSVGSLAIISLENKRLFKEELEKQKLEEELELAKEIQKNLLPSKFPEFKNFEIAATNISSKQVGGDYYDIINLDKNKYAVAIADVSGKGVPAALLMANIQAFLKTICRQQMDISEATGLINDLLCENITDGKFITFFWTIVDDEKKSIKYVNAGHNHPLLIRDGKIRKLDKGGMILGVMKTDLEYLSECIELKTNDTIIMFTDGITEAMNKHHDEFSDEKLEQIALNLYKKSAEEILSGIHKEVVNFTKGAIQSDDITLMVLKAK
ncbi:MAG TPA: SpoIIE family protein phosphatase [Ignavibacteriaceae bacterium]|nr:SpoIIE family protein phosphatase [Ignavibacteriaceae bacterium]